jgi:hypothetical protein
MKLTTMHSGRWTEGGYMKPWTRRELRRCVAADGWGGACGHEIETHVEISQNMEKEKKKKKQCPNVKWGWVS